MQITPIHRDMKAVRAVLAQQGEATLQTILDQGGEGLFPALHQLIEDGEVGRNMTGNGPYRYFLIPK